VVKASPKKETLSALKKKADKYFSTYVRMRDADKHGNADCISCNSRKPWKQQQAGHFITRGCNALRYDEENVNAQCVGCNMFKQGNQYQYSIALDYKYGDGKAAELHGRRFETKKFTRQELEEIIEDAKKMITFYETNLRDNNN
jgi:hypothetical protein